MRCPKSLVCVGVLLAAAVLTGCAKASPDTTGFSKVDTQVFNASFDETWDQVKAVLREQEFLIYTRDKRGFFVAYTDIHRRRFVPQRKQFTISVEPVTSDTTRVTIETAFQRYGVTLLTYPGWLDRPTEDNSEALAVLAGIQGKVEAGEVSTPVATPGSD